MNGIEYGVHWRIDGLTEAFDTRQEAEELIEMCPEHDGTLLRREVGEWTEVTA